MDLDIEQVRRDSRGFAGSFSFVPDEDIEGTGVLIYVDPDDESHVISDVLDTNVAEPLIRLLNAVPGLLSRIDSLESHVDELYLGEDA